MTLLTALRWTNGLLLLLALSGWLVLAVLQWLGRFVKGSAQTVWNVGVLFAAGFQTNRRSPEPPGLEWPTLLTGLVFFALWLSVFFPSRALLLHVCAGAAGLLALWTVWSLRFGFLGVTSLIVLAVWFAYYWAAAWRAR